MVSTSGFIHIVVSAATIIIVVLIFLIRERKIKMQYTRLEKELENRISLLNEKEKEIIKQKQELQNQINVSDQQNEIIFKQTIELEKSRRQLEKTVEHRTNELKFAKDKAEESDKLKTAFLENLSHEIRTPMNAIIGFASLLTVTDVSIQEKEKFIERINRNCQMLLRLIDDILDMSAIQTHQMVLVKNEFSVDKIFQEIKRELTNEHKELEKDKVKIELIKEENSKDYTIYTDRARFRQVMKNLLSNSTKFTEKGYIRFGYVPLFDSEYDNEPSLLQFFVEDTGIGIAQEKSEHIFKWFSKIEADTFKLYRGAGLGLYISRELIHLMGGDIWFNSKPNEGSSFYFTLPYIDTTSQKSKRPQKTHDIEEKTEIKYDWRKKNILIVEDEQSNLRYLSEIFKLTGASVIEARDGKQAVSMVKSNPSISIVLMDILLPEMDGYKATRKIKTLRPGLPVIAQTAYTNAREKERSLEAGCDGYISKPYTPPDLLALMANFI